MRIMLIGTALLAVLAVPDAHALICKSRKGKLTVRDACKKKETALTGNDLPETTPPPSGGSEGPRVVDAAGTEVGAILAGNSYYGTLGVLRQQGNDAFSFNVSRSGLANKLMDDRFFGKRLGPNCTGPPYLYVGYGSDVATATQRLADRLIQPLTISASGTKGYYVTPDGAQLVKTQEQDLWQPSGDPVSSSVSGAFLNCGGGAPIGSVTTCDPKEFCRNKFNPRQVPPQCFCLYCCFRYRYYGSIVVTPAKTLDLPAFTPPFHVER
jgi:hypothetical protein